MSKQEHRVTRQEGSALVEAVRTLFKQNQYEVTGPIQIRGAEVDLCARSITDPFAAPIYIEVTEEYVDTDKYGKDSTKFLLIREIDRGAALMLVSRQGFTKPVFERASESRVSLLTYAQLFQKFERFERYVKFVLEAGSEATALAELERVYQEPKFDDEIGIHNAIRFLDDWRMDSDAMHP